MKLRLACALVSLGRVAADDLIAGIKTNTYALTSSECYPPSEDGGWGFCGAPTCDVPSVWLPSCVCGFGLRSDRDIP